MPDWSTLLHKYQQGYDPKAPNAWVVDALTQSLKDVSRFLNGMNVLFYFSAFFQKPDVGSILTDISEEDLNGVMNAIYGMNCENGLAVIIHTPGGVTSAVEQITEYIHSKFNNVFAIVPVWAMSGGAMFALSCDKIIISKVGQLGPTDTQMNMPQGTFSVKEIIAQFEVARLDIVDNPETVGAWAPILQGYSPALYEQATKVEAYSKELIKKWLKNKGMEAPARRKILKIFHDKPKFHGQRIDYENIQNSGLNVELLEDNQKLQDAVLTAYHLATIYADNSPMTKIIGNHNRQFWQKNYLPPLPPAP